MAKINTKRYHFDLGAAMFSAVDAAIFPKSIIRYQSGAWAKHLGLGDWLENDEEWIKHFGHFTPMEGSFERPLALAYHGHQFGSYNPDIGDGRGFLYAQIEDKQSGLLLDFGTKGSGQTPYSRSGDGRLTLKGAVREVLATEMLTARGVRTSKTFSVIETGEALYRHDEPSPARSAVLVRLSHSHIRIGSFQRLAYQRDTDAIARLLRYCCRHYYSPHYNNNCIDSKTPIGEMATAFVEQVGLAMADLTASWMAAGFVHGVLNTDNFNITGESFDYGPWRFLPTLDPSFTAAYFDHEGRYCYGRQPEASFWALCRLADSLADLADFEAMQKAVLPFQDRLASSMVLALCRRLGIDGGWPDAEAMSEALFKAMRLSSCGFEPVFFDWYGGSAAMKRALSGKRRGLYQSADFAAAVDFLKNAPPAAGITPDHAYFRQGDPQDMLIDEVERIWLPIAEKDDWSAFDAAITAIRHKAEAYGFTTP